jgi:hypothetical protein
MKRLQKLSVIACAAVLAFSLTPAAAAQEHFSVKEYNSFHELLHPLEHEALPAKDFQRIRSNAGELVRRGKMIVRLGVPKGTAEKNVEDFRAELKKFKTALERLGKNAKHGTDAQLEVSFGAVHDSFEILAGMLPRK